ncbi:histidine phosphatase family protein [Bacillus infantis]|uniref:Histidine phosphatase family protein n=1 Tax=Bacillus infantis TaxID=324767 RepID=A0A5D4QRM2_9BACI|nr:histidine phosphatase family protein [Bacillus infantis]TYS41019.1 histidine phosphatase family protein [Bacillus infantis]
MDMNTEIYFIRHAHSEFSLEHEETRGLSVKGWADARRVADLLAAEEIQHILSSPYVRAIQTVEGLARNLGKEVELDPRFREGDLASRNHRFEKPLEALKYVYDNPGFKYPGGESNLEIQERGISALREAFLKYSGRKIAVGIHGHIMTCMLNYFDEKFNFDFHQSTNKPDIYKLTLDDEFNMAGFKRLWNPALV